MRKLKQLGFSDIQIGKMTGDDEDTVRAARKALGVKPAMKQIDVSTNEYSSLEHRSFHDAGQQPKRTIHKFFVSNQKCYNS